jgi:4-amino-4-deoxy-L-arabinose transferase-like glycosyltransferase
MLLGFALRAYKLNSVPPGLTWDEASLGYNAYSLLKTGRDEYGSLLPLTLKSFGDYKPALYAYIDAPFVALFGLNELAVRIPSVLSGLGFIILSYLIIRKIFNSEKLALSSAFFAAVSPVSIQFSRAAYESNLAVTLNMLGFYLFLKGLERTKFFLWAVVPLVLSMYTYQASKLFIPILIIGSFLLLKKSVKKDRNFWISAGGLFAGFAAVFAITFIYGGSNRLEAQNFFAYPRTQEQIAQITSEDGMKQGTLGFELFHGEWFKYITGLLERYFVYFSPKVLFVEGDYSPRHSIPDLGILNFYGLIFIPLGFYLLWMRKEEKKALILLWLFTASIPAVLSRDLISMVRALNLIFPFAVLEAFGFVYLAGKISRELKVKEIFPQLFLLSAVMINLALYLDFYFVHSPVQNAKGWLFGYKQMFAAIPRDLSQYNKVVISDGYGQPYIYYLFYKHYPPEKFQQQAILEQNSVDVGTVRRIDNIEFRPVYWPVDRGLRDSLIVGNNEELPEQDIKTEQRARKTGEISLPDGQVVFKIIENNDQ